MGTAVFQAWQAVEGTVASMGFLSLKWMILVIENLATVIPAIASAPWSRKTQHHLGVLMLRVGPLRSLWDWSHPQAD